MSRIEKLYSAIKKNLETVNTELIKEKIHLPLLKLLEPTEGHTPPNEFMLYCKDHASFIKNKPGDNSKLLSKMWDNEPSEIKVVYEVLSKVMSTSYKEIFSDEQEPWEKSATMPVFCINQNIIIQKSIQVKQDSEFPNETNQQKQEESTDNIQQSEEDTEPPFINEYLMINLPYYGL